MKSSENSPMDGEVHVDEFVLGGQENDKIGKNDKIGRSYDSKKKLIVTVCCDNQLLT